MAEIKSGVMLVNITPLFSFILVLSFHHSYEVYRPPAMLRSISSGAEGIRSDILRTVFSLVMR
jgi:hypothetical protein